VLKLAHGVKDYFRVTQDCKPLPAVYVYDTYYNKWVGGFYYGIAIKITNLLASQCRNEFDAKKYGKALKTAELYTLLADFVPRELRVVKGEALYWQAAILKTVGDFYGALPLFEQAEKVFFDTSFRRPVDAFAFANQFGMVYLQFGDFDSAEKKFQRVLKVAPENPAVPHEFIASAHSGMGAVYRLQKEPDKAVVEYKKALEMYLALKGDFRVSLATCAQALASVYGDGGHYQEAEAFYRQAEDMWKQLPDKELNLARLKSEMGNTEFQKKDYEKAIIYLKEALELFRGSDANLWDWIGNMNLLGMAFDKKGEKKEAVNVFENLIDDEDFKEAPDALRLSSLMNLAQLYLDTKYYAQAVLVFGDILTILSEQKENNPDSYLQIQIKIAQAYLAMRDTKNLQIITKEINAFSKGKKLLPETAKRLAEVTPILKESEL
jgi:tetratricopeptide (TPR) repeat protein